MQSFLRNAYNAQESVDTTYHLKLYALLFSVVSQFKVYNNCLPMPMPMQIFLYPSAHTSSWTNTFWRAVGGFPFFLCQLLGRAQVEKRTRQVPWQTICGGTSISMLKPYTKTFTHNYMHIRSFVYTCHVDICITCRTGCICRISNNTSTVQKRTQLIDHTHAGMFGTWCWQYAQGQRQEWFGTKKAPIGLTISAQVYKSSWQGDFNAQYFSWLLFTDAIWWEGAVAPVVFPACWGGGEKRKLHMCWGGEAT